MSSVISSIALQFWAGKERVTRHGRYLTVPMVKRWAKWYGKRAFKTGKFKRGNTYHAEIRPTQFRMWQWTILMGMMLWLVILSFAGMHSPYWLYCTVYWWPWSLLHADDLLTKIDKDRWRKRWQSAKNKVKWKWTPAMQPARSQV